jgi:hypothetical protein
MQFAYSFQIAAPEGSSAGPAAPARTARVVAVQWKAGLLVSIIAFVDVIMP